MTAVLTDTDTGTGISLDHVSCPAMTRVSEVLLMWGCNAKQEKGHLNYTLISVTGSGHIRYKKRCLPYHTFKQLGDRYVTVWEGGMCTYLALAKKKLKIVQKCLF